jgi:prepilin-type N-terminal cleavage/methylation domain-containing protein
MYLEGHSTSHPTTAVKPSACPPARTFIRRVMTRRSGFSLVELMVTIAILSLLIAAIVPTMTHIRRRSLATAIGNDLRVFATAFEAYAHESGNWPAETDPGALPPEMASRISITAWQRQTAMGGRYNWDNNQMHYGARYQAVIAISSVSNSPVMQDLDLFEAIDRVLDDGVLTTGNFRLGSDDEPILIVAP